MENVDYRSSKSPQALWNGHLTSANSDVRSGDNHLRHTLRWSGLIAWWQELYGKLPEDDDDESNSLFRQEVEPVTP